MVPTLLRKIDEQKAEIASLHEELKKQKQVNLDIYNEYESLTDQIRRGNFVLVKDADLSAVGRSQVRFSSQCRKLTQP